MKHLAVLLLALGSACLAQAQDAGAGGLDPAAERARIRVERSAAETRFQQTLQACRARFAVTDCVTAATREHNALLAELRRQERVLNQADRRQRAAEHQKELDERNTPERQQQAAERRARALADQKEREAQAAEKAAKKAADDAEKARRGPHVKAPPSGPRGPQGTPRAPAAPRSHGPTPEEIAKNRAAWDARVRAAETHRAEVRARIAKRSKPAASGLPTPP